MQLAVWCFLVLVQLCFVTATPHGYGIKTGAAARADASAGASAVSGLSPSPLGLPGGAGFSGSFLKSSSSSSSSSSASSSSSSFSYSGSGFPVVGGCSTGICNSGTHDKASYGQNGGTINGNQNTNYNHDFPVNAGATGQAGATVDSQLNVASHNNPSCSGNHCIQKDCTGTDCKDIVKSGSKCESGQCGEAPATHSSSSSFNNKDINNGCSSGQCGNSAEEGSKPDDFNLEKGDSPNKCLPGQCETDPPKCTSGQCAPSTFGHDTSPQSKVTLESTVPDLNSPVKDTPNDNHPDRCTTGLCKQSLNNGVKHTSPDNEDININVAKNANSKSNSNYQEKVTDNNGLSSDCAFGNCASNYPLTTSYDTHPYSPHNLDKSKCTSPNCKDDVYNHAAAAGGVATPGYNKPETYLTVPKQEATCVSPNCKPTGSVPGNHPHGNIVSVSDSQPTIPYDNTKQSNCAGEQCQNSQSNSYLTPAHQNSPTSNHPISGIGSSGYKCARADCAAAPQHSLHQSPHNYNSAQTPNAISSYKPSISSQSPFSPEVNRPSTIPDKNSLNQPIQPHYSSHVHNQPFQVKPNVPGTPNQDVPYPSFVPLSPPKTRPCSGNGCPGEFSTKPNFGNNAFPTQSNLVQSGLVPTPSISNYPSAAPTTSGHQPSNTNKPTHNNHEKPIYTGGFGGPPGLLKPNDYSVPLIKPVTGHSSSVPCSTGNCHSVPTQEHIHHNVHSDTVSTVGSFGGPPGLLKPNDYNFPHSASHNKPVAGQQSTGPCLTGNCHSVPSQGQIHNAVNSNVGSTVSSFGGPPGLLKPNDFNLPSSAPITKPTTDQQHLAPCATGNCPSRPNYGQIHNNANSNVGSTVSSFGGPPGLLKPNDFSLPSSAPITKPTTDQQHLAPCATGNCPSRPNYGQIHNNPNSNVGSTVTSFGGPPGLLKPNDFSLPSSVPTNKPTLNQQHLAPCTTGNCPSTMPNYGQIHNNANSNAGSTVSSFGSPPELLKPNDFTLPSSVAINKPTVNQQHLAPCVTGNCPSTPNGQVHNNENSNAASIEGNFGGSSGSIKPNDYSLPNSLTKPISEQQPLVPCSTGYCQGAPNHGQISNNGNLNAVSTVGVSGGSPGLHKPNDYNLPNSDSFNKPAVALPSVTCSTGNCNANNNGQSNYGNKNSISGSRDTTACATGKCGSPNASGAHLFNGAHASSGAAASANSVVYTGGFGGPPGFLKPYDDGNVKSALANIGGKLLHLSNGGIEGISANVPHSTYNSGAGSVAQAFAAAGANAGAFSSHPGHYSHDEGGDHKTGRGCNGGCPSSSHSDGHTTYLDGAFAGLSAAKAGAVSGANAGSGTAGFGGSFASSSASAHASAGAAVKGYGRR